MTTENGRFKPQQINVKDVVYIISFIIAIATTWVSFSNRFALVEKSVKENSEILKTNDLNLINYRLNDIDKKVDQILKIVNER